MQQNKDCVSKTCNCSEQIQSLQSSVNILQKRIYDLEQKQGAISEDMMLRCPGLANPSNPTWESLEKFISRKEVTHLMRRSGGWRKLVTNLVCSVFTKDVLIQSSVTGRNSQNAPLDPARRNAILDFILEAFPYEKIDVADFNQIVLAKIKNLRHIEKRKVRGSSSTNSASSPSPVALQDPSPKTDDVKEIELITCD